MIQAAAAEMFGASTATHVETVGRPSRLEQFVGETASVARLTRPFQAVDHNYFGDGLRCGSLRMNQDTHARLGIVQCDFHGEPFGIQRAPPVISRDGIEMGVLKKGNECSQNTILGDSGMEPGVKKERADKEAALKMDTRHRCNHAWS